MKRLLLILMLVCGVAQAEPLAEFEILVKRCQQAYDARPLIEVVYADLAKSWVKRAYAPTKVTYDVKKTDSLVAPFVAHMEIVGFINAERAADEEAANALVVNLETRVTRTTNRLNFVYRDKVWTIADGRSNSDTKRAAADPFPTSGYVSYDREMLFKSKGPLGVCVGLK